MGGGAEKVGNWVWEEGIMIRWEVEGGGLTPGDPDQFQDEAPLYL